MLQNMSGIRWGFAVEEETSCGFENAPHQLRQQFGWISASRMPNIHPPASVPSLNSPKHFLLISASERPNFHSPAPVPSSDSPKPPGYRRLIINRYKKIESEAFRPTTPGHSPGMGNNNPPDRCGGRDMSAAVAAVHCRSPQDGVVEEVDEATDRWLRCGRQARYHHGEPAPSVE
ncbi:unnamed protein product [Fraxinus pennsylvanica]|uniref:Uncharacterized protein n=1 Tax=Fraxinus pennsylvanica TaxID=56036 RepID=A0AAD1ZLA4_9LAMI|nr:unnamed protein product [Fraxinus pennsylvanica]